MNNKIGRNDPCHCGSGKKYKKCCLNTDIEQKREQEKAINIIDEDNDISLPEPWDEDSDFISSEDDISDEQNDIDPNLSDKQNEQLNKWWKEFHLLKDYKKRTHHIRLLFSNMPDLVEYAGLEDGAIFDLVSSYLKAGEYDIFIDFIFEFKNSFPKAFELASDYFNYFIIVWLISKNRKTDIPEYLQAYVDCDSEKLPEVIELLQAANMYDILIPLLEKNYKNIIDSRAFMTDSFLIQPLHDNAFAKYFKPDCSEKDIDKIIKNFNNINYEFIDELYKPNYWQDMLNDVFKPFKPWNTKMPANKEMLHTHLNNIATNYLGYLITIKKMSPNYALYLHDKLKDLIFKYYFEFSKKSKALFNFSINKIEKTVVSLTKNMMWLNYTELHSLLLTSYYFMDYLEECGNFEAEEKQKVQSEITNLFNSNFNKFSGSYEESLVFNTIP